MTLRTLKTFFCALLICCPAQAQINATLRVAKKQHLAGEPVIAIVTITNHAGRELIFQSGGRFQWLDFIVKTSSGNPVAPRGNALFGPMKIGAGESLAREVDLSQHFQLDSPGNYTVSSVIHLPGSDGLRGSTTNRVFFNQSPGRIYWAQKVGLPGSGGLTREFRLLNFTGDQKSHLYAQIVDDRTGTFVRTFRLGDVLMLRKPLVAVDRNQRMHVMFLATPTVWVHCIVNTDAKLVDRFLHRRGPQGDPKLLTFGDGSVRVTNSIPYDQKPLPRNASKSARPPTARPSTNQPPQFQTATPDPKKTLLMLKLLNTS